MTRRQIIARPAIRPSAHRWATAAVAVLALGATILIPPAHAPVAAAGQVSFTVTGSTQMYTLGALLADRFTSAQTDLRIGVNASSSQLGFEQTCGGSVQLGMSDVYIQDYQLSEQGCNDMMGIPVAISATTVVYNLPGAYFNQRSGDGFTLVHPVRLTAQVLASIYMNRVTRWNDPAIAGLNPGLKLPAARITVFNSSEPGGAGFVFSQWLSRSVPAWNSAVGEGALQPNWPAGSIGQASSGFMVQAIKTTPYSIGFAGFDFAISNHLQAAALRNASGYFVTPSLNGLSVAINSALLAGMPVDFRRTFVNVKDAPGNAQHAFNPACFEFFVVHRNLLRYGTPEVRQAIKGFLEWAVASDGGQKFIEEIEFRKIGKAGKVELAHGFIPVPDALRRAIKAKVDAIQV